MSGLKDVSLKDVSLKDVVLKDVGLKVVSLKDVVVPLYELYGASFVYRTGPCSKPVWNDASPSLMKNREPVAKRTFMF